MDGLMSKKELKSLKVLLGKWVVHCEDTKNQRTYAIPLAQDLLTEIALVEFNQLQQEQDK